MSSIEILKEDVSLLLCKLSISSRKLDTTKQIISFDPTVCNEVYPGLYILFQNLINILTLKGITRDDAIIKLNNLIDLSINIDRIEKELKETPFDEIGQCGDYRILYDLKISYKKIEYYLFLDIIDRICYDSN